MRRKGQNFLVDPQVIERIADYAGLTPEDCVLEIGPGTGNLTEVLSSRAGKVVAVEVDPALAANLRGRFDNVRVVLVDALKADLSSFSCNKIVSNLPYQISSKVTFKIVRMPFDLAVLMYQKEFAKKMAARPGSDDYGRVSVVVQHFCQAEILEHVPRTAFRPVPEVQSAIVRLESKPKKPGIDEDLFMRLVEGLFSHRRKKVKKTMDAIGFKIKASADASRYGANGPSEKPSGTGIETFEAYKSLIDKRPEELSPEDVETLTEITQGTKKA
jgi:16S rRNA (adenine1518-N6/adenine1519-N6)-dimethyltransferase